MSDPRPTVTLLDVPPTVWRLFNLRGSPYFQDTLEVGHERRGLGLFVGREAELGQLLRHIRGRDRSAQVVTGPAGVGKTTLVQRLKGEAVRLGYLATDRLVPFSVGDTPEQFFARALANVYDTVLVSRPELAAHESMQRAQQLIRTGRMATGVAGGLTVSLSTFGGLGANASRTATLTTPKDVLLDGPRLLHDLLVLARERGQAQGVVLHLNNLESLRPRDFPAAADLLLSLRDPLLMHDGLHVVLVGTADAVSAIVKSRHC